MLPYLPYILLVISLLPYAPCDRVKIISQNLGCGQTVNVTSAMRNLILSIGMFIGSTVIVEGSDLTSGMFRLINNGGNQFFVMSPGESLTTFGIVLKSTGGYFEKRNWEPPIVPVIGKYHLEFKIGLNKTVEVSNETQHLFSFPVTLSSVATVVAMNIPADTVKYICNCRAPNADANAIESCLGLN